MTTLRYFGQDRHAQPSVLSAPPRHWRLLFLLPLFQTIAMYLSKESLSLFCFQIWEVLTSIVEVWLPLEVRRTVWTCPTGDFWMPDSYTIVVKFSAGWYRAANRCAGRNISRVEGVSGEFKSQIFWTLSHMCAYRTWKINFLCSLLSVDKAC